MATPTNLPASFSTAQILTAGQMNDLRGAFRILQVVDAGTIALGSTTSGTYADSGLTATITPQSASSKILILVAQSGFNGTAGQGLGIRLMRGGTVLQTQTDGVYGSASANLSSVVVIGLDSPSTTSAVTYKTQFARTAGSVGLVYVQPNSNQSTIILCEVSA
jgi:hypothetical protein